MSRPMAQGQTLDGAASSGLARWSRSVNIGGGIITLLTIIAAVIWAFPLYWGVITSVKPEADVVAPGIQLIPQAVTLENYIHAMFNTSMGRWYINSIVTTVAITFLIISMGVMAGYAISQLRFPGRRLLYLIVLASFMIPFQALVVSHFVLMNDFGQINTWLGVILPQLVYHPIVLIVYKQFFDMVPREIREAAVVDGANEFQVLFKIYLPMNWGITTALALVTYTATWNQFFWPFLVITQEPMMTVTVGITQVDDAFGVKYARDLAVALLGAIPVALAYLIFQRRVTQAIMLSAAIKG
ncbi:carbohydrate ABC transporter permease [Bauldia sp.]|uniref:carbohydrate ABC transporter permease n=1 Tax=Bauldia sp. TaxID=2575872 RepID=UPI003BAB09B1